MRRIGTLPVAVLVAAGLSLAVVTPASASVATKTSRFCKDVANFDSNTSGLDPTTSPKAAGATAHALRKASKHAPRKVKKALRTMAGVYQRLADGESSQTVLSEDIGKYLKASGTFSTYYLKHCLSVTVPTTKG